MVKNELRRNMVVEIEKYSDSHAKFSTRILRLNEDCFLVVSPPKPEDSRGLEQGQAVVVKYADDLGQYYFFSTVIGGGRRPYRYYALQYPERVYRLQRRENVRVQIRNAIAYRPIGKEKSRGLGRDLSAGGVRFRGSTFVEVGEVVEIYLDFLFEDAIAGRVLRCEEQDGNWDISVAFVDLGKYMQEKIIQWLFVKQRRQPK